MTNVAQPFRPYCNGTLSRESIFASFEQPPVPLTGKITARDSVGCLQQGLSKPLNSIGLHFLCQPAIQIPDDARFDVAEDLYFT